MKRHISGAGEAVDAEGKVAGGHASGATAGAGLVVVSTKRDKCRLYLMLQRRQGQVGGWSNWVR